MAKILISFVGTGSLIQSQSTREYKTAEYHIGDVNLGEYPFVAAALSRHYNADKIILIGTAHSMWEEVYRFYSELKGQALDEDAYLEIAEQCGLCDCNSELSIPHQDVIEKALGNDSHIVLIRYGLNDDETTQNIKTILSLQEYINSGDELIVDVTHSFRSLPMIVMNLLIYLETVSRKRPKLSHIHYGMLEVVKEIGYAPIVELKKMTELTQWTIGASAFKNYDNAYQLAELLEEEDPELGKTLKRFSDLLNLNHLRDIENGIGRIKILKTREYTSPLAEMIVKPVFDDFLKQFGTIRGNHALFQYRLAQRRYDSMNYGLAIMTLQEAILTYVCTALKLAWDDKDDREDAKVSIKIPGAIPEDLRKCYWRLTPIRNAVAHSIKSDKSAQSMINELRKHFETAGKYIR